MERMHTTGVQHVTHIGTGPFKLAELQPGRVKLVRFEQYQARPEPPNGCGGGKTAWLDTLLFLDIPDEPVRGRAPTLYGD